MIRYMPLAAFHVNFKLLISPSQNVSEKLFLWEGKGQNMEYLDFKYSHI